MPPSSFNNNEHIPPVRETSSHLRTWIFDAETSDDDDSYFSFPNRPSTTSTTSTKSISTMSIPIHISKDITPETPVSDLGPTPATPDADSPPLRTEVDIVLCYKIRALKHFAHWSY
ncbi:hypothetical protein B9Z19DRAFT_1119334 [Tuber borchii]|uniref:Uncharacterized protein n=1 Tax=Tuber borchii TaxID=42251 RepID=A0A2T7A6L8_TUBBO|nr:hypothetical protein B9Z19DRAFT_1119334 [Tuber borchii]